VVFAMDGGVRGKRVLSANSNLASGRVVSGAVARRIDSAGGAAQDKAVQNESQSVSDMLNSAVFCQATSKKR
jgi:hypothetical protein